MPIVSFNFVFVVLKYILFVLVVSFNFVFVVLKYILFVLVVLLHEYHELYDINSESCISINRLISCLSCLNIFYSCR